MYRKDTQRLIDAGHSIVLKKAYVYTTTILSPIEKNLQKTHTRMRRMRKTVNSLLLIIFLLFIYYYAKMAVVMIPVFD